MFVYGWFCFSCLWNNSAAQAIPLQKYIFYRYVKKKQQKQKERKQNKQIFKVCSGKLVSLVSSGLR